jgi:hypothetical protein
LVDAEGIFDRAIIVPKDSVRLKGMTTLKASVFWLWGIGTSFAEVIPECRREFHFSSGEM